MSHSARFSVWKFVTGSVFLVVGCGTPEAFHDHSLGAGGPAGMPVLGTGGGTIVPGSGGVNGGTGGAIATTGGSTATGGRVGTGGATATGGATGTGGATTTGGRVGTGGATTTGGGTGTGGRVGTGGATTTGGATGTGGRVGSGGATATGGATGTGGRVGTGGATGTGGTTGPGSVLFMDDFETGTSKWIPTASADWSIVTDGSMVYKEGAAQANMWRGSAAGNVAWTNVVVEARIKVLAIATGSSGYFVGLCARVRDANNRYCFAVRGDDKVAIRKIVDGAGTSGPAANITNGLMLNMWYTARLQVTGSTITGTLSLNGTQVGVATDSDASIASGGIQVGTHNATAQFDDVRVTAP